VHLLARRVEHGDWVAKEEVSKKKERKRKQENILTVHARVSQCRGNLIEKNRTGNKQRTTT